MMACSECEHFVYCPSCGKRKAWYKEDSEKNRYRIAIHKCDHKKLTGVFPYSEIMECKKCGRRFAFLNHMGCGKVRSGND